MQTNCNTPRAHRQRVPLEVRFWSKVDKSGGPDACWPWTAYRMHHGYGVFGSNQNSMLAHRMAYLLIVGSIPDGMYVCHHCDNTSCVNVRHLFVGTQQDNMRDASSKGRISWQRHPELVPRGDQNPARLYPERISSAVKRFYAEHPERVRRGEANGCAKLTEEQVREMRQMVAGGAGYTECMKKFGVSRMTVSRTVRYLAWNHVP